MDRDLSPTAYLAPGMARLFVSLILSAESADLMPLPLDVWKNNYSPSYDATQNFNSGFNAISIPDTVNSRFFILIPPRNNTVTMTLKGVTGDTGIAIHPNGITVLSLPASSPPSSIGITAGGAITGVRVIIP